MKGDLKQKRIGVLLGGLSSEREISLRTGQAVLDALRRRGYETVPIEADRDLAGRLHRERVEVAWNALHGKFGEDGSVQGLLEVLGIPYTGSGVISSALAMNKVMSKIFFEYEGLPVASYHVLSIEERPRLRTADLKFGLPIVVKPRAEGSSIGVSIVRSPDVLDKALDEAFRYDPVVLIEEYIDGREICVGIFGDRAIGTIEVSPKEEFYNYRAKYTHGQSAYRCPADLPKRLEERVLTIGEAAHRALGCSDYSRVDLRLSNAGEPKLLEVNSLPGMTETSLVPKIAASIDIDFDELIERILLRAGLEGGEKS